MRRCLPVFLALMLSSCVTSQRTIFLKAPSANQHDSVDIGAYETRYGKHDGVFLDIDESVEHSGRSEQGGFGATTWDYHYVIRRKYLVLNPDVEYLTTFKLTTYRGATIGTLYLQVTSPGGRTTRYGIKDLIKESASKSITHYKFIYPNIVKGSVIEEGFELGYDGFRFWPPLHHDVPLQFRIPCEHVSFTYACPDWWDICIKSIGQNDTIPYSLRVDPENRKKILSCIAQNVPAVKDEPYDPHYKEMARYLEFMVSSFQMGRAQYKAPANWTELVSRYSDRLTDREGRGLFSSRVQETTERLVRDKATELERLTAIMDFLQSNIEKAEDSEDRDFADVLKDKKGSAYSVTGLANMMLQKAGLRSNFIMVHSAEEGYFDPDYHSFDQLSIPAVLVDANGREFVLLPYRKDIPFDHVPEYLQGQQYVVVSAASNAVLATIPSGSPTKNSIVEQFKLDIATNGLIGVAETKTIQGSYAYYLRKFISDMNQSERDKFLKELVSYSEGEVKIVSHVLENEKEHQKPLILRYSYTIDNLITHLPDEVLFHTAGLFTPTSLKDFRVESEERTCPIRIYYDDVYEKDIEVRYPDAWEMKTVPQPVQFENMFGSLKLDVENSGHLLKVKQRRSLVRNSQPKEKIAELARLTGSKASAVLPTIVFMNKP
jgi:hypothetical protein